MTTTRFLAILFHWVVPALAIHQVTFAADDSPHDQSLAHQTSLTGVITNSATGRALEGARVVLGTTGRDTLTDQTGTYRFNAVTPGPVVLKVSFTGLNTTDVSVEVSPGARTQRDIGLTADIYTMGKFVVSGEREGNAQAITLQRLSDGIRNVVSTDAFGSLSGNPADLVMRLPGVEAESVGGDNRYIRIRGMNQSMSTVTIDGDRVGHASQAGGGGNREVQWQTVGSDTIERVEVVKSPTPDMDGDSIGGAVNLVSKSAFDSSPERRIRASTGVSWRAADSRDRPRNNFTFSYSEVFSGRLGVAFNASYRTHGSFADTTTSTHEQLANGVRGPAYTAAYNFTDFRNVRSFTNGGIKLDYKLDDHIRFSLNAAATMHLEHGNDTLSLWNGGAVVATRDANGNLTGTGGIVPGYTESVTEIRPLTTSTVTARSFINGFYQKTRTVQFSGLHRYDTLNIDYSAYASRSKSNYDGNNTLNLIARGVGFRVDHADTFFPTVTQTAGPDWTKLSSYTEANFDVNRNATWDNFKGVALNVKKQFELPVPTYIKAGFRLRNQTRQNENEPYTATYVGPDGVRATADDNLAQFGQVNRPLEGKLARYYQNLPWPAFQAPGHSVAETILEKTPQYFQESIAADIQGNLTGALNFSEKIDAYYLIGNVVIAKLSILGGVRVETTTVRGEGALQHISPAEKARRAAWVGVVTNEELRRRTIEEYSGRQTRGGTYRNVLPGLHFKYSPTQNLVTRLSYATNIGRPNIGQLVPRTNVNDDSRTLSSSNPSLKPQTANNFDLSAEYYFEPAGQFTAGVFLKEIRQFIYTRGGQIVGSGSDNGFDGNYEGYQLTSQANGGFAKVKGLELGYSQQFRFLPGIWKGLGAFANFTRLQAEGNYATGLAADLTPTPEIAGFNPLIANLGFSYIRKGLSIRLQGNYRGRYLLTYNANASRLIYARRRATLDIKTSYEFSRHWDFSFDMVNALGAPDREREWGGGRPQVYLYLAPQFLFGINGRL